MVQGHIKHLNCHCHCRVLGDVDAAAHVQSRFRAVADQALLGAYEVALDQVLGDDEEVIVIRRIDAPLAIHSGDIPTDAAFARLWGERLAGSVMRCLAASTDDTNALMRFTDQAEYVARFISDLLAQRAWDCWYYGAFTALRNLPLADALRRVLLDNPDHIARVLTLLRGCNAWDDFVTAVGDTGLRAIWHEGVRGLAAPDAVFRKTESFHGANQSDSADAVSSVRTPVSDASLSDAVDTDAHKRRLQATLEEERNKDRDVFLQVCRLIDRLELWVDKRNLPDTLFIAYRPRVLVDWRDRASLSAAVCDMIDYLAKAARLRSFSQHIPLERVQAIEQVLKDYDWLDTDRLRAALFAALRGQRIDPVKSRLTPRQRQLIEDLLKVLGRVPQGLQVPAQTPALALFLYSALIENAPRWKDDTLAARLVEAVAFVRAMAGAQALGPGIREALGRGDAKTLMQDLPGTAAGELREGLHLLASLGEEAGVLIESSGESRLGRRLGRDTHVIETPCAGALLLLRAIVDVRLPAIAARLAYPRQNDAGALLLPLFMRLAGEGALTGERIDPALRVVFDPLERFDLESLQGVWGDVDEASHQALEAALLKQLAGQRLFKGAVLQLFVLKENENALSLIAGDEDGGLWPMGRVTQGDGFQAGDVVSMLESIAKARAQRPQLIIAVQDRACLTEALAPIGDDFDLQVIDADAQDAVGDSYRRNRQALVQGLQSLHGARLGLARTDLALGLMALGVLRVWARWLRRFAGAGAVHLFDQMLRRPGVVHCDQHVIDIELQPAPLDIIVEMAGYFGKIESLDILGGRDVTFRIRRSS